MAQTVQSSFSAGELDPALWERTGLDKYQTGLRTLRNAHVGKTGRIISRAGRKNFVQVRNVTQTVGTVVADNNSNFTKADHMLATGDVVTLSSTGDLPDGSIYVLPGGNQDVGLTAGTVYYVIHVNVNTFKLATTLQYALDGFYITLLDNGTGTHTVTPGNNTVKKAVLYSPPYLPYVIEWGHAYARVHNINLGTYVTANHGFTSADLPYIQFFTTGIYTYILCFGKTLKKMITATGVFVADNEIFKVPTPPIVSGTPTITGTGYGVNYIFTWVAEDGQESPASAIQFSGSLPITATEKNTFVYTGGTVAGKELRAYRRPFSGNAFGYIGSSNAVVLNGGTHLYEYTFIDYGAEADYTQTPPTLQYELLYPGAGTFPPIYGKPRTGCIYQQRLILTDVLNEEAIHASRTGFQNNFYSDHPVDADSALTFKCGTTGNAKVLRLLDNGGLLAFTTVGIFKNSGALSVDNLSMDKIGNFVIEQKVPPLEVPGGIIFVDKATNTVRTLIYSNEAGGFPGEEISIYSNHLFLNKNVVSWAFQDGDIPLVWVIFDDGSLISLTYQREQQMQAWGRHDTTGCTYESVCVVKDLEAKSVPYFIVKRGANRFIEYGAPRFVADIKDFVGMDAAVTFKAELASTCTVTPVVADTWDGSLNLAAASSGTFANTAGNGAVGSVFKFFDSDGSAVNLTVTTYTNSSTVRVLPDVTFPEDEGTEATLYKTYTSLTGLTHLEGESVAVLADGYVVASPNNTKDNLTNLVVTGGALTLPSGYAHSAIVHVGLPFVSDAEPLDIDTVEKKPTLLESMSTNRVYVKVYNTRGMYIANEYPDDDSNTDMVDPEVRLDDSETDDTFGNACQQPYTRRLEIELPGDWKSNGRVCIRQVDPLPLEILSLIPDLEIYRS